MSAELIAFSRAPKSEWQKIEKNLFRYVPTGEIWVRKTFDKERLPPLRANTHEVKSLPRARKLAEILIGEWRGKYKAGIVVGRTVGDVIAEVLRVEVPNLRAASRKHSAFYLNELRRELGHHAIDDFSRATWATWFDEFRQRKNRKTFNDYRKDLNFVLRYAYDNRMARHLITIPNPDKSKDKVGRVYSLEEIDRLDAAATTLESQLQLALGYGCGMRKLEALHLEWNRISLDTGLLVLGPEHVKTGSQTGQGRTFFVTKEALELLRAQRSAQDAAGVASGFVFPSPTNSARPISDNKTAWKAMKRRAGIKGRARFHDLRHSRITHLLLTHKLEPIFVSQYVGTSLETIQRVYLHGSPEHTRTVADAPTIPLRIQNRKTVSSRSTEET